ncbi:hypothetical protein [Micromonospora pisi]|nr:hypothetical protein [Micromonospora pisi]
MSIAQQHAFLCALTLEFLWQKLTRPTTPAQRTPIDAQQPTLAAEPR